MSNLTRYDLYVGDTEEHAEFEIDEDTNGEWVKFDDIKEFLKPTANDRYMTALEVFREFLDNTDGGINGPFQQWCRDWSWRTNRGV